MRQAARTQASGALRLLCWVAVISASAHSARAGQVVVFNFGTGVHAPESHPVMFHGTLAPAGTGTIAVGTFPDLTDAQIATAADSPAEWPAVASAFVQLGQSAQMGTGAGNFAGLFSVSPSATVEAGSPLVGRPIYVVVGNAATVAASLSVIVFKSTHTFSSDTPGQPSQTVSLRATPDGSFLNGALTAPQVMYSTGPLAGQSLWPINCCYPEESDPYATWINRFFGPSDPRREPTADPDGDGLVNAEELTTGTLPDDFASALRIQSIDLLPNDVTVVTWSSVPTKHYVLLASEDGVAFSGVGAVTAQATTQSIVLSTPRPVTWFLKVRAP